MRRLALLSLIFGLALAVGIIAWHGCDDVAAALNQAGPRLLWLTPYYLGPLALAGLAWQVIFPAGQAPPWHRLVAASWIGSSVNWLLPVAQVGGEIAKATWLARRANPAALMVATTIVDKALQAGTQAFVALLGAGLLLSISSDTALVPGAITFAAIILALVALFFLVQSNGLLTWPTSLAARLFKRPVSSSNLLDLVGNIRRVDDGIRASCASPLRLCLYVLMRLASRLLIAGEIWLTLHFLGHPIGIFEAVMFECLVQTVRSAAFPIPGAYGVQEGAFVMLGVLVGIPPHMALAVSLAKRLRELSVGVPGLIYLQVSEAHRGFGARRAKLPIVN